MILPLLKIGNCKLVNLRELLKKLLVSLLIFVSLFVSSASYFVPSAKAQSQGATDWGPVWYDTHLFNFPDWFLKVFDDSSTPPSEVFGERYTAAQVQWIQYSLISTLLNTFLTREGTVCIMKPVEGDVGSIPQCLIDLVRRVLPIVDNSQTQNFSIAGFFVKQPISGIGYVINKANNLHIMPEAYAQGFGYKTAGSIFQNVWVISRNIAYSFLVLVVIFFAFMIMFRMKLSPQTVISIQSALPRIIIAAILVTFSYAIVGFLIDLMYVAIGLLSLILTSGNTMTDYEPLMLFDSFVNKLSIFSHSVVYLLFVVGSSLSSIIRGGNIAAIIFPFIVFFHVIFSYFKIIIMIFKAYAMIVVGIITAPLEILFGTLTGNFTSWIKKMASHLSMFPLLCGMFFFAFFFLFQASGGDGPTFGVKDTVGVGGTPWFPPLLHSTSDAGSINFVFLVVSYVIFVTIPKAAEIASGIINNKMPNMENAIGEPFGAARGPAYGLAGGLYDKLYYPNAAGAGGLAKRMNKYFGGGIDDDQWFELVQGKRRPANLKQAVGAGLDRFFAAKTHGK